MMKRLCLILPLVAITGCAHTSNQHTTAPNDVNPQALHNQIEALQAEVDMLTKELRREQSELLDAEAAVHDKDLNDSIAIRDSLNRQKKVLEQELQATKNVTQSPF